MTDRNLRRAGLDYLAHVEIVRHVDFSSFDDDRHKAGRRLVLLTTHGATPHIEFTFTRKDILLLGRESAGVPPEVHANADARVRIPLRPHLRSLNIAVAAALVAGEALRQTNGFPQMAPEPG